MSGEPTIVIRTPVEPHWEQGSALRPVDSPIAWIGNDRVLLDDVSRCGLHRRVIACKDAVPHQVEHLLQVFKKAGNAKVDWRMYEKDGFYFLWIFWKEGKHE